MHQYSFFTFDYSKPEPAQSIDALTRSLADYLPPLQVNQIKRAYYYAEQAHEGQNRRSGEPYVTHPLAVAGNLPRTEGRRGGEEGGGTDGCRGVTRPIRNK